MKITILFFPALVLCSCGQKAKTNSIKQPSFEQSSSLFNELDEDIKISEQDYS